MENTQTYSSSITLNNGISMPLCGLGTAGLKDPSKGVYEAIKSGVRMFDCAQYYQNEKEVGEGFGKALKDSIVKREELFIISKIWMTHYDRVEETIRQQLKDLQVEYLDLYMLHWPLRTFDQKTKEFQRIPMYKLWAELERLVKLKLVRSIGVSNFNVQILLDILTYCEIKPAANEIEIHPYLQQKGLVQFCQKMGIQVIAFKTLTLGVNPKYVKDPEKYQLLKEPLLSELAKKYKKTETQIALNWAISQNIIVIPRTNTPDRMVENLESVNFRLEKEDVDKFDKFDCGVRFVVEINFWEEFGEIDIFS